MPDYNINLTIQNIWHVFRIVLDIGIMWFILYYAILFVRNNNRTIQIFKGIIFILIFNGIARLLGLTTLEYFSNTLISWVFLAVIIIFQPEIRGALEKIGKTMRFQRLQLCWLMKKKILLIKFTMQPLSYHMKELVLLFPLNNQIVCRIM